MLTVPYKAGSGTCEKSSGEAMRTLCLAAGVLALLICSFPAYSTEVQPARAAPREVPSDPAAASALPDEITMESSVGYVVLPHDVHIKGVKLKCVECHHQIRAGGLDTPHPDYLEASRVNCQTCHETDSKGRNKYYSCSHCHHSDPDDIADETLSSKVVIHKSCWRCHESGTGAEASAGCANCHVKEGG
jgi:hypothetical protein